MAVGKTVAINEQALASDINSMAQWGEAAGIPATEDVLAGSFYYETDTHILKQEQNGSWVAILQIKTLNAASETVEAGYYAATTLSAVDADLAEANIKTGKTIFGFAGTVDSAGVDTFERYYSLSLNAGATYTPAVAGMYYMIASDAGNRGIMQYYSDINTAWYAPGAGTTSYYSSGISDGTNMRVRNGSAGAIEIILMRWYHSIATYERYADEDIAASGAYTPASGGVFVLGGEVSQIRGYLNFITAGWASGMGSLTVFIGDGTNFRVENDDGGAARVVVLMRLTI